MDEGEYERAAENGVALHEHVLVSDPRHPSRAMLPIGVGANALWAMGAQAVTQRSIEFVQERTRSAAGGYASRVRLAEAGLGRNQRDLLEELGTHSPGVFGYAVLATNDAIVSGDLQLAGRLLPQRDHPDAAPIDQMSALCVEVRFRLAQGNEALAHAAFVEHQEVIRSERVIGHHDLVRALCEGADGLLAFASESELSDAYAVLADRPTFRLPPLGFDTADVVRGAMALRLGEPDAAERHYLDGLGWARRPDVRFGLVEGRCLQGLAELAGARGERTKAAECLDAAGAKFAEYGAKFYLDQVLARKQILRA
jgi:hypothetical protein